MIFYLNLSSYQTYYVTWIERPETDYFDYWKKLGIFDLLQLSKLDVFNIDISMVMVVALLWNQNTCALELPCGPVSPTLLNVVVITSLML